MLIDNLVPYLKMYSFSHNKYNIFPWANISAKPREVTRHHFLGFGQVACSSK